MAADTIEARVARGAALLDEKLPGWVDRIDLARLDLASPCRCILGQTWDDTDADLDDPYFLHSKALFGRFSQDRDAAHGFNVTAAPASSADINDEFAALTAEWRRIILARRGGAS